MFKSILNSIALFTQFNYYLRSLIIILLIAFPADFIYLGLNCVSMVYLFLFLFSTCDWPIKIDLNNL